MVNIENETLSKGKLSSQQGIQKFRNSRQPDRNEDADIARIVEYDQAWSFHSRGCAIPTLVPKKNLLTRDSRAWVLRPRSFRH